MTFNAFQLSLVGHVTICVVALLVAFLHGCISADKKPDVPMFTLIAIDTPADEPEVKDEPIVKEDPPPPPPPPEPPPLPPPKTIVDDDVDALIKDKQKDPPKIDKPPVKEPPKIDPPKPDPPKPDPPKPTIKVSNKRVTRTNTQPQPPPKPKEPSFDTTHRRMTDEEMKNAIAGSITTQGNPQLSSNEKNRIIGFIASALKNEWVKESVGALEGTRPALVEITLDAKGRVTDAKIITSSGSPLYDEAAKRAALRTRIPEVTPAFLKEANNKIRVPFDF